jgi:hypothetical protein
VPYGVFSPVLPFQIKFALWLTDLPEAKMGNLVIRPGSQHEQYFEATTRTTAFPTNTSCAAVAAP